MISFMVSILFVHAFNCKKNTIFCHEHNAKMYQINLKYNWAFQNQLSYSNLCPADKQQYC